MERVMFARLLSTEGFSPRARNALNKDIGKVIPVAGFRESVMSPTVMGSWGHTQHSPGLGDLGGDLNYELLHD